MYGDPRGHRSLREAVANHVSVHRAVRCTAEQVVIVSGVQQALDLAARVLLDPGRDVWVEDPGYPGAHESLPTRGASLVGVPVDDEGLIVQTGIRLSPRARLARHTSHQFSRWE